MAAAEQPLLASSLRDLTDRLASPELKGFARQEGFGADVRKWRATLSEVMDLLVDAEEKQNTKAGVKNWLIDLTHLAYDLDDVLDDLEYELLRRKKSEEGVQEGGTSWSEQIQSLRSRIEEITGRFEEIEDDGKYVLKLQANPSMRCTTTSVRLPTTSLVERSDVVGRDKDVEAILELLPKTAGKADDKAGRRSGNDLGLNQLGKLHQLRGSISISRLDRVKDVNDACEANLKAMKELKEITLEWYHDFDNDLRAVDQEFQVYPPLSRNLLSSTVNVFGVCPMG
ncbi:Rx, N-terminal [Dillenia turbinata]|uniref:Rx, N-terminal n=1 Tax=Dillenia turbinata TaxID=194707 RepID=A0AAN8VGL5_9MAGN